MRTLRDRLIEGYRSAFGEHPEAIVRAPGRVNLIGEHTDYNYGFVLPMAIDRGVCIALGRRGDRRVVAQAMLLGEAAEFSLEETSRGSGWGEYLRGVAWALGEAGLDLEGWQGVVGGDLPMGAGLSSSAALEVAAARAFAWASSVEWEALAMAKACQRAENEWVGVGCGIMDQIASAAGVAGHALLIDCRSLRIEALPLPTGTSTVVLETGTRRRLVGSAYNDRRRSCQAAAAAIGVATLRDVDVARFEAVSGRLDEVTRKRARHVISENERVLRAAEALRRDDAVDLGMLMNASHASLRDDFEVSSKALDAMVACAREHEACLGARMTGAGFGGSCVAIARSAGAQELAGFAAERYKASTGNVGKAWVCRAATGAEIL